METSNKLTNAVKRQTTKRIEFYAVALKRHIDCYGNLVVKAGQKRKISKAQAQKAAQTGFCEFHSYWHEVGSWETGHYKVPCKLEVKVIETTVSTIELTQDEIKKVLAIVKS